MNYYFDNYVSNSLAPSSNQSYFCDESKCISRSFYKVHVGGKFEYSFLFSNTIYSTYADGSYSQANLKCDKWEIFSLKALVVDSKTRDFSSPKIIREYQLTFDGKISKEVEIDGEIFTDGIVINAEKGEYICLEMEFFGDGKIPYFEEILIPAYRYIDGKWQENRKSPLANMIGVRRNVDKKIGFLGDSITEGLGTPINAYKGWSQQIGEKSSENNSYWNLGIGFGRADDIATDGIWLDRAKNLDIVTLCIGVNDICQGFSSSKIKDNIEKIVKILNNNGVRVILFTVPPFDYDEERTKRWKEVNEFITNKLSKKAEIFDTISIWGKESPYENMARYGGHPNVEGCEVLANEFVNKNYF
ncbi:MAG: hypothetical protein E7602_04630 [Ruminococcaceae bacterium]|nr:hypothetical protein [Oscillospiraceae bacterium]